MNIAHYFLGFPPLHGGGFMIYARDLAKEQLKMRHNVIMLMPGKQLKSIADSKIKYHTNKEGLLVYQIINSQPVSFSGISEPKEFIREKNKNNYNHFLEKNKIRVLHVHSLIGFPLELIEEAKKLKIKTVFTTHDYFGLCPTMHLYKYNNSICCDFHNGEECILCNNSISISDTYKIIKSRNLMLSKYYDLIKKAYDVKLIKKIYRLLKAIKVVVNKQRKYEVEKLDKGIAQGYLEFRNYYINTIEKFDAIIFNSHVTKKEYEKYIRLDNMECKVLPVTHSAIEDNRKMFNYKPLINNKVIFLFMGYLNNKKGFLI